MGKKKLKRRIVALEAEMAEMYHKCRQCETCENSKPKTVTWRRFKPLEQVEFEKMQKDAYKGNLFMDTHITCEGEGEAEE